MASEACPRSAHSMAVQTCVARWGGWPWVVDSGHIAGFPPFSLSVGGFSVSRSRRCLSKCRDPCSRHFLHLGRSWAIVSHELTLMFPHARLEDVFEAFFLPSPGTFTFIEVGEENSPAQRSCWRVIIASMLVVFACERTLMLVRLSSHWIRRIFRKQRWWYFSSALRNNNNNNNNNNNKINDSPTFAKDTKLTQIWKLLSFRIRRMKKESLSKLLFCLV